MKREIKFRVWVKPWKWMDFPTSISIDDSGHIEGVRGYGGDYPYTDIELMQYTGLRDQNGREIYEGDLICVDDDLWEVEFHEGEFVAITRDGTTPIAERLGNIADVADVAGNIYENPDLLEVAEYGID